jgi:hypothetical protein
VRDSNSRNVYKRPQTSSAVFCIRSLDPLQRFHVTVIYIGLAYV